MTFSKRFGAKSLLRAIALIGFGTILLCVYVLSSQLTRTFSKMEPNCSRTYLNDVLFTVKTGKRNHQRRLSVILKTWYKDIAKDQIFFVTDEKDSEYQNKTGNRLVYSSCGNTHERDDLCCKTGVEFDLFLASNKRWWCHLDDDNYVNVDRLVEILNHNLWNDTVYVARRSVPFHKHWKKGKYWFGTGGAGYCITRPLAIKMAPFCGNGTFVEACHLIMNSDDCTIGFIITNLLKLTISESMSLHSHIEKLKLLNVSDILEAGTLSFAYKNTLELPPSKMTFPYRMDPTRFLSLHCWLHPSQEMCNTLAEGRPLP